MFEDVDAAERKTEDEQMPADDEKQSSWWVCSWAHVLAGAVFCLLYLPFQEHPWSFYIAIAASYSVFVFGRAFGSVFIDGDDFFGDPQDSQHAVTLLLPHAFILVLVTLGAYLWLHLRPVLPPWVTHEGHKGSLWLVCGLLPLIYVGIRQGSWMAGRMKRRLDESGD
jgi:hypothetical protein